MLMAVLIYSASFRLCQISFHEVYKGLGILKLLYANQWFAVVVIVVVGGFRIRFGSGCLEPMSTTPKPLCFSSRCSSREWARPTCPWSCACGRAGVHGYACVYWIFCSAVILKRPYWLNTWNITLETSFSLEPINWRMVFMNRSLHFFPTNVHLQRVFLPGGHITGVTPPSFLKVWETWFWLLNSWNMKFMHMKFLCTWNFKIFTRICATCLQLFLEAFFIFFNHQSLVITSLLNFSFI